MSRKLSVFEKHQLRIARKTLNMPDEVVALLGGMTKEEAKQIIKKLSKRRAK